MKMVFIPTYPEVGEDWLLAEGYVRQDGRKDTPAVYKKGDNVIVVAGMGYEPSEKALKTLKEEGWFEKPLDLMLGGTAGSYTLPVMTTRCCKTPFPVLTNEYEEARAVTVYEFVSPDMPRPDLHQPGVCFEMESEAYLKFFESLPQGIVKSFTMIKLISDDGSGSFDDWEKYTRTVCQPYVHEIIQKYLG